MPALSSRRRALGGFTLLEVMVAVAILAVALTAIFGSEAGAIRVASRARFTTTATLLARCKMGEIEETIARDGLPAVSAHGTDACCEDGETEGFECDWEVSRIVLPEQASLGEGEGGGGPLAGLLGGGGGEEGAASSSTPAEPPSVDDIMSGTMTGGMGGGGNPIAEMALQFAFPILKPQIEEQVRRATVTVRWHEGTREQSFEVVQFLVAEQPPAALTEAAAAAATGAPVTGVTPSPASGQGTQGRTGQ